MAETCRTVSYPDDTERSLFLLEAMAGAARGTFDETGDSHAVQFLLRFRLLRAILIV
jgi:hypothetical protein